MMNIFIVKGRVPVGKPRKTLDEIRRKDLDSKAIDEELHLTL